MKIIKLTSRSITIELDRISSYDGYEYTVFLNDVCYKKDTRNVISIFDLNPSSLYKLRIDDEEISFETLDESLYLDVKLFNAKGNGVSDDTAMIQAAIACCPKNGVVGLSKGTYLVSSLFLKSDMTLYFESGAKLLAKTERSCYPILPGNPDTMNFGVWEGSEVNNFASIINVINSSNVSIVGDGEIDCQAELGDWYVNHRVMNIAWRGHAIFTNRSSDLFVGGLYVHNTQSWAIHPYFSSNVIFANVHIKNNPKMPTTDGIDPDCSDNVSILGCKFDVGDDCIAIKSGTIELAKKYRKPCSNIVIRNNLMSSGHGGVVFGSESSGGIENVKVEYCKFINTDRGLRIKTRRGRGNIGSIDNVLFSNIEMDNVKTPFVINMYYNMGPKGGHEEYVWTTKKLKVDENTPVIGHLKFSNMKCMNVSYAAGVFLGLPESKIKGIELENVLFTYLDAAEEGYPVMIEKNFTMKKQGLYCFNVENVILNNVVIEGNDGPELIRKESE